MAKTVASHAANQHKTALQALHPDEYSSRIAEPTVEDIQAVMALDRFAGRLQDSFCTPEVVFPADCDRSSRIPKPETPDRLQEWSSRVRKSIYRTFMLGAALAPVYCEPTRQSRAHSDPDIQSIGSPNDQLSNKQMVFLSQFAVYNLHATRQEDDDAFGTTAEWLAESILADSRSRKDMAERFEHKIGRAEYCQVMGNCPAVLLEPDGTHSDAHLLIWQVAQALWAHFHIDFSAVDDFRQRLSRDPGSAASPTREKARMSPRVVLFGSFNPEPLILHEHASDAEASSTRVEATCPFLSYSSQIFCRSGAPNKTEPYGDELPPLTVKFFNYFFRRFVGLQFRDGMFTLDTNNLVQEFYQGIAIFSHDNVQGRSMCAADDDPNVASGDVLNGVEILEPAESLSPEDFKYVELEDCGNYPFW